MKKLIFTGLLMISASVIASAQDKKSVAEQPAKAEMALTAQTTAVNAEQLAVAPKTLTAAQVKEAEKKAEKAAKNIQTKLGLNATQYKTVYEAQAHYQKICDQYPAGKVPTGLLSNITSERDYKIKAALTEQQAEKYTTMQNSTNNKL